jgi:vancomycin aglycone glucosyltransferase
VTTIGPVAHPALFRRVAAVVHHGGAGTTTTAARAGVPQVVVPHLLDQFYWAARVTDLGLGVALPPRRRLTADALAGALAALRDNDLVSERAAEMGSRLRDAMRGRDVAAHVLRG